MLVVASLPCLFLLALTTSATSRSTWKRAPAIPFHEPTALEVTSNHVALRKIPSTSRRSCPITTRTVQAQNSSTVPLTATGDGQAFLVPMTFGEDEVFAVLDTGSSDTWLAQSGFQCVDKESNPQDESACMFGRLINSTFDGDIIKDTNFNVSYADGEFLNGNFGYENITLGGVSVMQQAALANYAFWNGDGISSGLIGFAYPSITSQYNGTNATADVITAHIVYDPLFTTMFKQGLIKPMFSLALNRGNSSGSDGYLALGGLPPVNISGGFTSTPILLGKDPVTQKVQNDFYTIKVDAYVYNNVSATTDPSSNTSQSIVDSGTTELTVPTKFFKAINAAFSPPARFIDGGYFVECNATAPALSVKINGTAFDIQPVDLISQSDVDNSTGLCASNVQDAGENSGILGDVFLKNVVAVFDVGAGQMRFAQRSD